LNFPIISQALGRLRVQVATYNLQIPRKRILIRDLPSLCFDLTMRRIFIILGLVISVQD